MNVMTIILSATASLLVAALILTWQQSDEQAQTETVDTKKKVKELSAQVALLQDQLKRERLRKDSSSQGVPDSGRAGAVQSQIDFAKTKQTLAAKKAELGRLQDQLNATNNATFADTTDPLKTTSASLADQDFSSSALAAATGNGSLPSNSNPIASEKDLVDRVPSYNTFSSSDVSADVQQRRRKEISASKVYAHVVYVKFDPEGDTMFAELTENSHIQEGAILAVRRRETGIAGRVRIVKMFQNGSKDVLSLEPVVGATELVLRKGDELILEPAWSYGQP